MLPDFNCICWYMWLFIYVRSCFCILLYFSIDFSFVVQFNYFISTMQVFHWLLNNIIYLTNSSRQAEIVVSFISLYYLICWNEKASVLNFDFLVLLCIVLSLYFSNHYLFVTGGSGTYFRRPLSSMWCISCVNLWLGIFGFLIQRNILPSKYTLFLNCPLISVQRWDDKVFGFN